jgi:hypothetical protein
MSAVKAVFEKEVEAFLRQLRSVSLLGECDSSAHAPLDQQLRAIMGASAGRPSSALDGLVDGLVEGLCELALGDDAHGRDLGRQLIFVSVAEHLSDSFEPDKVALYDRLFARVIDYCRRQPTGRALDLRLSRFGVASAEQLLARKQRLERRAALPVGDRHQIRHVLVPSRVTLGADVAVTSIVLQKIERVFPRAESVVLGPIAVRELLEGSARAVRFVDCPYHRRGGLMARLDCWAQLVDAVDEETASYDPGSCLILDPDSRLTQLGLLPLIEPGVPTLFFESRAYRRPDAATLGALTAHWLDDVLGPDEGERLYPRLVPSPSLAAAARRVASQARASSGGHVTTVTLGVGGNAQKRIPGRFELDLLRALLTEGGAVIFDKGIDEEVPRAEAIIAALASEGVRVAELASNPDANPLGHVSGHTGQLLVHHAGLRSLMALVSVSDLYVGYDSAFQHVAAALAIPVLDIFVNPPNPLFAERWRPHSTAPVTVVDVAESALDVDGRRTLSRVLAAYRAHRATMQA